MSELKIKDGDGTDKYIGSMGTGATGDPYYNIPSIFELEVVKGNVVNHADFEKHGKNGDIDIGDEDIWNGQGLYTGFPTGAAETMEVFSSSVADDIAGTGARTILITNLLDGTGAAVADVEVDLSGTTPVSLGAGTYTRCSRMIILTAGSGGENAGQITLRHTSTTANIFAVMHIGANQTNILAYTVPLGKTLYLNRINFQLARANGSAGSADVSFRVRELGGVFQSKISPTITNSQAYVFENNGWREFVARTDIKGRVDSVSDSNTIVSGDWGGILVTN